MAVTKRWNIVLHSDFPPETCRARLAAEIDVDQWTLFSFSGYKGSRPVLGRIKGDEFRLHKRRYWHNSWGPVLFGKISAYGRGARVEAYWDTWKWPRVYMRIWLGFAIAIGAPAFLVFLREAILAKSLVRNDVWLGLVVPLALLSAGILLPRVGTALSSSERPYVIEFLRRTLLGGDVPGSEQLRVWKTTMEGGWRP